MKTFFKIDQVFGVGKKYEDSEATIAQVMKDDIILVNVLVRQKAIMLTGTVEAMYRTKYEQFKRIQEAKADGTYKEAVIVEEETVVVEKDDTDPPPAADGKPADTDPPPAADKPSLLDKITGKNKKKK